MHGAHQKYMINYNPAQHQWAEMHTCVVSTDAEGKPSGATFIAFDNISYNVAAHRMTLPGGAAGVSLIGRKDFKMGDEIITYWINDHRLCYHGRIIDIDEGAQVARLKMRDDNDSWIPFVWMHKLVKPTWEEMGWKNPNATATPAAATGGGDVSEVKDLEKIFWIFNNSVYDELRKQEGCGTLTDLKATTTDCLDIMKMAKGLGVPD